MPNIATVNGIAEDNIATHNGGTAALYNGRNGDTWVHYVGMAATGGQQSPSTGVIDGDYKVHTFTGAGGFTVTTLGHGEVEYLVLAAGGGGSHGGGGAGGYRAATSLTVIETTMSIAVGGGGPYGGADATQGTTGNVSSFSGGSGGGWGGNSPSTRTAGNAGGYSPSEGYGGGSSRSDGLTFTCGGGGGGHGGAGGDIPVTSPDNSSAIVAGQGGIGTQNDITGTNLWYAGGGGGGGDTTFSGGTGGSGVGGNGASYLGAGTGYATVPTANRGGGGGGNAQAARRSTGADGVVIIRYKFQ